MRRREILETRWELRSAYGVAVMHRDDAMKAKCELRKAGISAGVYRVRRSAPAKLRAVALPWRYNARAVRWSVITNECTAHVEQREHEWAWHLCGTTDDHTIFDLRGVARSYSGHAAFVAVAEAARAMGYRLPPAPEER